MDDQTLVRAFTQILGTDNETRKGAEQLLSSLEGIEGLYPRLCSLALSDYAFDVRLSAVLFLKNSCKYWKETKRQKMRKPPMPEADKLYLRMHIVSFLLPSVPEKLRLQFEEIAKSMAENLFPAQWPEVYGLLDSTVLAGSPEQLYAGLTLLHQLAKTFEYNTTEHRSNLPALTARYFGRLQQCLLQLPLEEASFPLLVLILKAYYAVTYIDYSEDLAQIVCFDLWIGRMKELMEVPLGLLETQPGTTEEAKRLEEHPAWVCKRCCAQIMQRCFQRETNLHYLADGVKALTVHFCEKFSVPLVTVALGLLLNRATRYVPDAVTNYLWKLISQGAKSAGTKDYVHGQVLPLLNHVLLAQVCRVPYDEELWANNPIEFIRKENDMAQAWHSAKSSAVDFLITVCTELTTLQSVLAYLKEQFQANPSPLHKEALLLLFGSLAELINKQESLNPHIESALTAFVYPDLTSPSGFLRSRAVSVYGMFASAPIVQMDHQESVIKLVCRLLVDPELPVKIEAAITLSKILGWANARRLIEPEIKNLLDVYLEIMKKIDSEELMDSMETLVGFFSDAVVPYSVELTRQLSIAFERMAASGSKDDEGATAMAAVSTLNILLKILEAVREHKPQMAEVGFVLLPVLHYTLSTKGDDFLEEGLSLLGDLLFYMDPETLPQLFTVFPLLIEALVGSDTVQPHASDHIELMYIPLANIISKYKQQFLSTDGVNIVLKTAGKLLTLDEDSVGYEYHLAIKLLLCLLENYPQEVQTHLRALDTVAMKLVGKQQKTMKLLGVELFAMLCWVNPNTSAYESTPGAHESAFQAWARSYARFSNESSKLHSACGMLQLIMTSASQPLFIQQRIPVILKHLIPTLNDLRSMEATEDDDNVTDVVEEIRRKTRAEEDDDDDDWSPIDEDMYESSITLESLLGKLRLVMQEMQAAGVLAGLTALLEPGERQMLESLLANAS
jgi:hypothetical protein